MAEETREEYEARVSEELGDQYRQEAEDITSAAEDAREDERNDDGRLETWDDYNEHVAQVPGIFGDTDTTAGAGANLTEVPSAQNELATVEVAEKDEAAATGDEEAQAASNDEARRQADVAGGQPSAEEVQAGSEDSDADTPAEAEEEIEAANEDDEDEEENA
jgi:hypothetical protein